MKLAGKVSIITGGGSGIGRATALLFAREGARLAIVDRDTAAASAVVAEIKAAGGDALALPGDVADPATSVAGAKAVLDTWERIDILMTAAGFSTGGTVLTTTPEDWNAVFAANVGGTWLWARAVIPTMQQQQQGAIITIASQLALAGGRGNSSYIASKGAILSLTRTMALDFAGDGIRVNAIAPGAIETPMLARSFGRRPDPELARAESRARHALGRLGLPGEIAAAALYLAGDDAAFTTGTTMVVDGGWLAA